MAKRNGVSSFTKFITRYFDQVYVINLDIRPDRMEQVNEILSHYNINYKRISGVYLKDKYTDVINNRTRTSSLGHLGCILSHVKCCQDAIDNNYNRILVLEDDITFVKNHIDNINFKELYNEIQTTDWDLFYLGATFNTKLIQLTAHLDKPSGEVWATQSIGYNKNMIAKITSKIPSDPAYYMEENRLAKVLPIDVIYDKSFKNNRVVINPIICVQNTTASDIVPSELMVDNTEYQLSRWHHNKSIWYEGLDDNIINIKHSVPAIKWSSSSPTPEAHFHDPRMKALNTTTYTNYKRNEQLAKLIEGKTISYVCSSPHVKDQGDNIDSFDLVARINQNFPVPQSLYNDRGSRTDIQVNCCNEPKRKAMSDNINFIKTMKFILCPMIKVWEWEETENFLKNVNVPYDNISDGYLFKIFKEIGTICNTGLLGIITLLNYDIKLYVTGMTFFNMNTYGNIYYEQYHDHQSSYGQFSQTPKKHPLPDELRMDIHNNLYQIEYFKKIVKEHYPHKLLLDDYLIENFVDK